MKKLVLIILVIAAVAFSGCGKDDNNVVPTPPPVATFCWECTLTITTQGHTGSSKFTRCGLTQTQIREVEKENTYTKTISGISVRTVTKCKKK